MTPGWMNVRNGLAESRPRGMPNVRARTWLACAVLALLLWFVLATCVAHAPLSLLLTAFP